MKAVSREPTREPSRRDVLRMLCVATLGAATGCAPVRIALHWSPADFRRDPGLVDRVLRAFAATVLPGAEHRGDPARVFSDEDYPFAPYAATFAADLCGRAERLFGAGRFDALGHEQRTAVIQAGLRADGTTRKLYTGAIFLAQISFYAGIYDESGCSLIDFEGRYRPRPIAELTYPDPERFLARELTAAGNPA